MSPWCHISAIGSAAAEVWVESAFQVAENGRFLSSTEKNGLQGLRKKARF